MALFSKQNRIVVNNRYNTTANGRNNGLTVRLTLKKTIILLIILLLLLVWTFFVGVLVGQGISSDEPPAGAANSTEVRINSTDAPEAPQLPEEALPPVIEEPPLSTDDSAPESADGAAAEATPENAAAAVEEDAPGGNEVISPEELSFMSDLKDKPTPPQPGTGTDTSTPAPRPQTAATPPAAQSTQTTNTLNPEDPAPKATTPPGPGIFDYQYQVAASTDLEGVKRLVNQLRDGGLRASMVQGTKDGSKIYRVHVDFRGTPGDTNQLREQLSKFGIDRVLLKTKVATQ